MSSTTTNLGLTKMTNSETIGQWSNANNGSGGNLDIIDTKMGPVGNTSLQAQVNALNSQITSETHGTDGAIKYFKTGRVVSVIIEGNITIGSGGSIGTLPEGYRPISTVYFLLSPSGSSDKTYLASISTGGAIVVYNRSESFGYAYATVTFIA